jgi:hypothetical protein
MADIDILFEKIFEVTRTLSESNGRILTFLEITERKIPDKEEISQLRESIGKSDKTIVELLDISGTAIKNIQENLNILETINLQNMQNNLQIITDYVTILQKSKYTDDDISKLGEWNSNIHGIAKHTRLINTWGTRILGVITFILVIINYWSALITVFTKLFGP